MKELAQQNYNMIVFYDIMFTQKKCVIMTTILMILYNDSIIVLQCSLYCMLYCL